MRGLIVGLMLAVSGQAIGADKVVNVVAVGDAYRSWKVQQVLEKVAKGELVGPVVINVSDGAKTFTIRIGR